MPRCRDRSAEAGVTLVEILVVLVLVAVLAGGATLSLGRLGGGDTLLRRAETLAARLTLAAETAAATGRDAAIGWAPDGYRFSAWDGAAWIAHPVPGLGRVERLDRGTDLSVPGGDARGSLVIRADMFPPAAGPLRLVLRRGDQQADVRFDGVSARVVPG